MVLYCSGLHSSQLTEEPSRTDTLSLESKHSEHNPPPAFVFDDADADVVLRRSDQVDFLVYKVILSRAPPLFKTMLSLPRPPQRSHRSPRPIIDLAENSRFLTDLLTIIFPHASLMTDQFSLDDFIATIAAASK